MSLLKYFSQKKFKLAVGIVGISALMFVFINADNLPSANAFKNAIEAQGVMAIARASSYAVTVRINSCPKDTSLEGRTLLVNDFYYTFIVKQHPTLKDALQSTMVDSVTVKNLNMVIPWHQKCFSIDNSSTDMRFDYWTNGKQTASTGGIYKHTTTLFNGTTVKVVHYFYQKPPAIPIQQNMNQLAGSIDSIHSTAEGNIAIRGWACQTQQSTPVKVEVYADAPRSKGGTFLATATASRPSKDLENLTCGKSNGLSDFYIELPSNIGFARRLYVHAILNGGTSQIMLDGSGTSSLSRRPQLNVMVFDPSWYLNRYPDLKAVYGSDLSAATRHWLIAGINEGRQGSPVFSAKDYLQVHPDLAKVYGAANYSGAIQHWLTYGINEGRQGSPVFSPKSYLQMYPDVAKVYGAANYSGAIQHWLTYGILEKRVGVK